MKSPNNINTSNTQSNNELETSSVDKLEAKNSARELMEKYGDRIIYTDENGKETHSILNPWAMQKTALKSPEDMLILGQVFQHMADRWQKHDETGWDEAIKVDSKSMLGQWIERQNSHQTDEIDTLDKGRPNRRFIVGEYGDRIIYQDENGNEMKLTLDPLAMIEDSTNSPNDMHNAGVALVRMANRWHNGESNPDRLHRPLGPNGDDVETGWDKALRVDSKSSLGSWIARNNKKTEDILKSNVDTEYV